MVNYDTAVETRYLPDLKTEFIGNTFSKNKHMQVEVLDFKFWGSLI